MRKVLEKENICESLKGRVQYFATRYRKSHDQEGRVSIRLDGNEVFKSCFYDWENQRVQVRKSIVIPDVEQLSYGAYWDKVHLETKNSAGFDQFGFYKAFYFYQNHNIDESTASPDPIVRLFAVFDKRVGKRTLIKIAATIESQPKWLQILYRLRWESDGIFTCSSGLDFA